MHEQFQRVDEAAPANPAAVDSEGARPDRPQAPEPQPPLETARDADAASAVVVAAVGLSRHGEPSLKRLFAAVRPGLGVAWAVAARQLAAGDGARLAEMIGQACGLPSQVIEDGLEPQPDHVYVAPDDRLMSFHEGRLRLAPAPEAPGERGRVDSLLASLAAAKGAMAIGVLLAGVGPDGTAGVIALKEGGGLIVCERDPEGSGEDAHPLIDPTGLADFVLDADVIPDRVARYAAHLRESPAPQDPKAAEAEIADQIIRIAGILRKRTGHDFHAYKPNTFLRRVQRRMQVNAVDQVERYVEFLREDSEEVNHLFQDLLIGVTQFFRDKPEFDLLERKVVHRLFEGKGAGDKVRVWVLGCATGEEAYSIAILLREHMGRMDVVPQVQIFATDIDGRALAVARAGRYPDTIVKDVPPERLLRWFSKEGETYRVNRELREMCIFSQHNVIRDAPFSRVDLVSCRNLLIYLMGSLQDRLIPLFHFALRGSGFLFLGSAENVSRHAKLFSPVDRQRRIFQRLETPTRVLPQFPLSAGDRAARSMGETRPAPRRTPDGGLGRQAERVAERHAPAYVLVDPQYEVLHFSGRTGRFLEPAPGTANLSILNLVHRDLRVELRAALQRAAHDFAPVEASGLTMEASGDGRTRRVDLTVEPLSGDPPPGYVVLFRDSSAVLPAAEAMADAAVVRDQHVQRMESELRLTRERLQASIEELESTNEELQSSNEEFQSINEELQSANEELETSKEELQSINEELQTVNGELAERVSDLGRANNDLKNFLEATQIATLFLDNDLRVKTFTPAMAEVFHLIDADVGRPISHIAPRIAYSDMRDDIRRVLRTLTP